MPGEPSPAQIASARATWVAAGNDGAVFDEAAGITPSSSPAPATAPTGSSTTDPATPPTDPIAPTLGFTVDTDRSAQYAQALLNAGVDPQLVAAAAKADGLQINLPGPDARSDDERGWDQAFAPAASADQVQIDYSSIAAVHEIAAHEFHALDQDLRGLVVAAKMPAKLGASIMSEALADMNRYPEDEASRTLYDAHQSVQLGRLIDNPQEAIKDAAAVIQVMRDHNKEVVDQFIAEGGFKSANTIALLAHHYRRLAARGDMAAARGATV